MGTADKYGTGGQAAGKTEETPGGKVAQKITIEVRAPLLVGQPPAININVSGFQDHIDVIRLLQHAQSQIMEALAGVRDQAQMQAAMAQAESNGLHLRRH